MRDDEVRIVFRATEFYETIINQGNHPDYLGDALERGSCSIASGSASIARFFRMSVCASCRTSARTYGREKPPISRLASHRKTSGRAKARALRISSRVRASRCLVLASSN